MAKSSGSARLGRGSSAIVDVVQRRQAGRLAKVAFIVVWLVATLTVGVVAWAITSPLVALLVGVAAGFVLAVLVAVVVFIWPGLRLVWYWSGEIAVMGLLLLAYTGLTALLPWPVALLLLTLVVGLPFGFPASRRWLLGWCWCAISRHRLRSCFATFIRANRYGSLPLIGWARPTPAGERVWVWLRPGLSIEDLTTEGGLGRLAVGCWASEVRIARASRRAAAMLRVDITRRNPLIGVVTSPLVATVPDVPDTGSNNAGAPVGGLDLPDVPEPASVPVAASRSRTTPGNRPGRATASASRPAVSVATNGGEDLNEWV